MDNFWTVYLLLLAWIAMGAVTAHFARQRGRDPIVWFVVGLLFGVLGLVGLFVIPEQGEKPEAAEPQSPPELVLPFGYKRKDWFYLTSEGEQIGPLPFELLQQNWSEGNILEQTYIWCDGMKSWLTLGEIRAKTPDFFA